MKQLAVIGGGWAGLAAAVAATQRGWQVTVFEMAHQLGGRARSLAEPPHLDNGQHILIGAYRETLALMRTVGANPDALLARQALRLRYPQHEGLRLPEGAAPLTGFVRAVLAQSRWRWRDRLALLWRCQTWRAAGFKCAPRLTVTGLCQGLPEAVMAELIAPLCVAALNTPADQASAQVFLRVLHDALFGGRGSADLLLPRRPLSELFPGPADHWLREHGAEVRLGHRVQALEQGVAGWHVDGKAFDTAVLACPATEAARLAEPFAPAWSQAARALRYEPIVTVYLQSEGTRLPAPLLALHESAAAPAQFALDLGQLGHQPGLFAFVISGARPWVEAGLDATGQAVLRQASQVLAWQTPPSIYRVLAEKRATFACTPDLLRPNAEIARRLTAAGDYIDGPYPATIEGAVRAGLDAVRMLDC